MASSVELDMENKQLKAQIHDLKLELEDKESQMALSGKLGNELLQSNNELNRHLEEIQESHLQQMEELRQENYCLRMKIDQEKLAQKNFSNEMELMKEKLERNAKQELARQEIIHEKKMNELQAEIDSFHSELEKNSLVNEQLHAKVSKQEEMLAEAHKYSKQLQGMGALESQLEDMKEECALMRLKKEEMKIVLDDVNAEKEQLLFDRQNLMQKIEMLKKSLEETSGQGKTWFDALQNSRQQLSELQLENSVLKAEALNRSHKDKGNSLFGEVEDRRLELEQQHTALSAKYKSLSTTHQIMKKQLIELKTRILPMLTMAGNQADSSKMRRLEAAVIQSKSEIQSLYVKIEELEKEKDGQGMNSRLERFHDVFTDFKDKKDYVVYLQDEIKNLNGTIESLKSKNAVALMKLTGETDKRRQVESQLHASEVDKEKLKLERVRLQIKIDEMKMKFQQAGNKVDSHVDGSNKNENSKPSLWKDASLFAKADVKTNTIANEKTLRPSNFTTAVTKPPTLAKNPNQMKSSEINSRKSQEILSTRKSKPVGMVSPRVPSRTQDETQQAVTADAVSTPANDMNRDTQSTPEPRENSENESTSRPNTQNVRTVKPRRVIHVRKDAAKNECQQQ